MVLKKKVGRQKKKTQKTSRFTRPIEIFEYSQSEYELDNFQKQIDFIIFNKRLEKIESEFKSRVQTIIKYCTNQIYRCSATDIDILYIQLRAVL